MLNINLEYELCNKESPESTLVYGGKFTNLNSQIDDLEYGIISYSPPIATNLLECESLCGSESLICTL